MQQDQEGPSRLAVWDSKRADGWRAGKRKRSPSPPPLAKHKTPQEILAYKPEQTENGILFCFALSESAELPLT